MGSFALVCGAAAAAAVIAAAVILARHGLATYRAFRDFSRDAGPRIEHIAAASEEASAKAERLNESSAKLQVALDRFSVSRARLNVLIAAVKDVQETVQRVTDIHPKKGRA
jgi:hypothetical protein